jgi:hypothetical protein
MKRLVGQSWQRLPKGKRYKYLVSRCLLAIIFLVSAMSTIAEADCWEDSLKQVNRDFLVTDSGEVYRVLPSSEMTAVFWLPSAHVTICDETVDVGGDEMTYYQIRNWDDAVAVWAMRER